MMADGQLWRPDLQYVGEEGCHKLQELQRVGVEGQVPACDQAIVSHCSFSTHEAEANA